MISQTIPPDVTVKYREIQVTNFEKLTDQKGIAVSIGEWLDSIKKGKQKELIEKIRSTSPGKERDALKKQLPAVTVSGTFDGQRKATLIKLHSGLLCIDFDKVENLEEKLVAIKNDPYCVAVFLSPSGNGIKAIVPIDPTKHLSAFKTISKYFKSKYDISADQSGKDVSRLTYTSYDPDLYYNENAVRWSEVGDPIQIVLSIAEKLQLSHPFPSGTRNASCFKLASNCKKERLDKVQVIEAFEKLYAEPDFDSDEIRKAIENAYKSETDLSYSPTKLYTKIHEVEEYINSRYDLRFNEVSQTVESRTAGTNDIFSILNEDNLMRELMKCKRDIGMAKLQSLLRSDFVEKYNPFKRYFDSLGEWQPTTEPDYIEELMKFITVKDQERFKRHFKKMLIRTIACSLEVNVFNKQCLVLVQKKQNSGKSTFCRWLCPPALGDYITENINTDKDSLIALATNMLINLDELATLGKAEINSLKSFMSKDKINARLPYDRKASVHPRRASFVGSTNQLEFLVDETGSVRWLCFELENINFDYKLKIDINDVWRQAYQLYRNGEPYQLTPVEIEENERSNKTFQIQTYEMEWAHKFFVPCSKEDGGQFMQTTDMVYYIERAKELKLRPQLFGKALRQLGFDQQSGRKDGTEHSLKGYYVKIIG